MVPKGIEPSTEEIKIMAEMAEKVKCYRSGLHGLFETAAQSVEVGSCIVLCRI